MRRVFIIICLAGIIGLVFVGTATAAQDLKIGAFLPERSSQAISSHENKVGRHQDIIMFYQAWGFEDGKLDAERVQWILDNGSIPMITWEPWTWGGPTTDQPDYKLSKIIAGDHDTYIRRFAQSVKQVNGVVYLRPMHEMNGDWYPWAGTVNGNNPSEYVPAFRHIVNIFRQEGVGNVRWVWSPNNAGLPDWGTSSFQTYYPGDNYVDFAAIDGYNSGTEESWSKWESFPEVFDQAYGTITGFTQKPIIIAETASSEAGGNKANWITNTFDKLKSGYPKIFAVIWFNEPGKTDWRIESSAASLEAYKTALANLNAPPVNPNNTNTDKVAPTGRITINLGASRTGSRKVRLGLRGADAGGSGINAMRIKNTGKSWGSWQSFASYKRWTLTAGNGNKTVDFQLKDGAGNVSSVNSDAILYSSPRLRVKVFTPKISTKQSKKPRFRVKWRTKGFNSAALSYTVKYRSNKSKRWRTLAANTRSTSRLFKGRKGRTYYFKVIARDGSGNHGVSSVKKTIVPYNDRTNIYSNRGFEARFYGKKRSKLYSNTLSSSYSRGDEITYRFKGNFFGLITTKNKNRGRARIYIDGKYAGTAGAYSSKFRPRRLVFKKNWKKTAVHIIRIVNMGTPGRTRFDVDALAVGR